MRYTKFLFILVLLTTSCAKSIFQENDEGERFLCEKQYNIRVEYYDSLHNKTKRISYFEQEEATYIIFYENGKIKYYAKELYLSSSDDFKNKELNNYNLISFFHESGYTTCSKPYYDSFYEDGGKKTCLVPSSKKYISNYMEYYQNGNIKSKKQFKHEGYGDFFVPYGEWFDYDQAGKLMKKYNAPSKQDYEKEMSDILDITIFF
jgi:antitoxin component YwqK of YwqJK toxin-antitoxin module